MDLEDSAIDPVESESTLLLMAVACQLCRVLNSFFLTHISTNINHLKGLTQRFTSILNEEPLMKSYPSKHFVWNVPIS